MAKTSYNWFSDSKIAQYQKFLAALTAAIGILISQGLLAGTAEAVVNGVIGFVGALLVALLPNAQPLNQKQSVNKPFDGGPAGFGPGL